MGKPSFSLSLAPSPPLQTKLASRMRRPCLTASKGKIRRALHNTPGRLHFHESPPDRLFDTPYMIFWSINTTNILSSSIRVHFLALPDRGPFFCNINIISSCYWTVPINGKYPCFSWASKSGPCGASAVGSSCTHHLGPFPHAWDNATTPKDKSTFLGWLKNKE